MVVVVVVVMLWLGVGLKVVVDKHEKASVVKKWKFDGFFSSYDH